MKLCRIAHKSFAKARYAVLKESKVHPLPGDYSFERIERFDEDAAFDIAEVKVGNAPITEAGQKGLFGRTFEKLGQERRIGVLKEFGIALPVVADAYERIREIRNRHLHLAQLVDVEELARDARQIFRDAVTVVAAAIGQDMKDGTLVLTESMARYLERAGAVTQSDDAATDPKDATTDDL